MVELHKAVGQPEMREIPEQIRTIDLHEEATVVFKDLVVDDQDLGDRSLMNLELHGEFVLPSASRHARTWSPPLLPESTM